MGRIQTVAALLGAAFLLPVPAHTFAQATAAPNGRGIPARVLPAPAEVSPELRRSIAPAFAPADLAAIHAGPRNTEEWRALIARTATSDAQTLAAMRATFPVEVAPKVIAGVRTYTVTPARIASENRGRVLVHLHGGAYVTNGGESAVIEAIPMAHYGNIAVISVDYRRAPDHPFPAALDDAVAVWKEVVRTVKPRNAGLYGVSAGGGLALALVHRLKELRVALPGAIAVGTPWSDLTKASDTYFTNEYVDDVLVTADGLLSAAAKLYAGAHDPRDPLISPVYGDFRGFPPTMLVSGTRDLFLSNAVRVHRKLRHAGIAAELQVFEGMSHAEFVYLTGTPESREAFGEIARFFAARLAK